MKLKFVSLLLGSILLVACGSDKSKSIATEDNSLVKKRIIQKIEIEGMGMLKELKIESLKKFNDTTFTVVHTFINPVVGKEVRITTNYYFNNKLDSITNKQALKTEMKSQGEWVDMGVIE